MREAEGVRRLRYESVGSNEIHYTVWHTGDCVETLQ